MKNVPTKLDACLDEMHEITTRFTTDSARLQALAEQVRKFTEGIDIPSIDTRYALTKGQKKFYDYVAKYVDALGVWPTYYEMQNYFGWASPHSVTQHIQALCKKGWLRKRSNGDYEIVVIT
jgi:hypothetical protein